MSEPQTRQTDGQAPADVINGMDKLYPRQVTPHETVVLSLRNGGATAHHVDIRELSCDCGDMDYNQDGNGICDHLAIALYEARKRYEIESGMVADVSHTLHELKETANVARDAAEQYESGLVAQRDTEADATAQPDTDASDATTDDSPPGRDIDASEAADRLKDAYDAVVDDMQVQAHEGWVWVQTGRDTPDELPGPGNVDPFTAFLKGPEAVEYIHDEHDAVGQKPGEWWKNRIAPEAVDEYIQEVLE
jgi:hypothetical protein